MWRDPLFRRGDSSQGPRAGLRPFDRHAASRYIPDNMITSRGYSFTQFRFPWSTGAAVFCVDE